MVHQGLNEGQQVGRVLDFIENNRAVQSGEKPPRILPCEVPLIEGLQREVAVRGKGGSHQGGLAGPPRAGEGDHRIVAGIAEQVVCEEPVFWGRAHISNLRLYRRLVNTACAPRI
jgi:hypothetical protein